VRARLYAGRMTHDPKHLILPLSGALAGVFLLAGCGTQGEFPSLARRQAELTGQPAPTGAPANGAPGRIEGSAQPDAPAAGTVVRQEEISANLAARLRELGSAAREAHRRFEAKQARAGQLTAAARGAAPGSEAWSVATIAVGELEAARSDAMVSLGELDRLYAQERIDGGDGGAIAAVRGQVTAWVADEDAVLVELAGRLKG